MANKTLNIRLRNKYDTEANWNASNPVLLLGECAFTSDGNNKGRYKVGDGSTQWKNLEYATVPWSDVVGKPSTFTPSSHTHDDRYYTESEINAKLDTKADTILSDLNIIKVKQNFTSAIAPSNVGIASSPFARDLWHDHFAFLNNHTIESNQVSTDGETWTDDTLNLKLLFQEKENQITTILSTDIVARRFVIKSNNIAYSFISWIELGVAYTNPFSNFILLIEKSLDKDTWSQISRSTISGNATPFFIACDNITNEKYLRFTLTKITNLTNGSVNLTCIKALSNRKGDQGLGIEYEYPYDWDADRNIFPYGNNTQNLGVPSRKWANVYASNFVGNASTATALTSSAGNATQPIYFKDGKPATCTYTLGKSVPADAKFTDTNTWRGIQNNLTSDATDQSLSAAQGKILKTLVDGKADASHTHKYAGSSSVAGAANSAVKLTTARTINGTSFDGSGNITTAKWGTSRDITIGNKKKPLDGSTAVAWTLAEIGASAIGHKHTKSEITDFPSTMKNPKGIRFLLPATSNSTYWHEDYDHALNPDKNSDYTFKLNDRIKDDQDRELVYDGSQYPIINLAKMYQAGGVNYLTHTTSMKYAAENNGLNNYDGWMDDCNWTIYAEGDVGNYEPYIHYINKNTYIGNGNYYRPSDSDHVECAVSGNSDNDAMLIFHIKKNAFKDDGSGSCNLPYTFSFEIGDGNAQEIVSAGNTSSTKCGIKIFDDSCDIYNDTPMYEEIWGKEQIIKYGTGDKVSVSFLPRFDRTDATYSGIKIVIYGREIHLDICHLQLERGNIPSDWRPALSEIVDGTYQNELESM